MNTNPQALTKFYSGYAPDVVFDDPAFSLKGQREVADMWRMLCAVAQARGHQDWRHWVLRFVRLGSRRDRALCQ